MAAENCTFVWVAVRSRQETLYPNVELQRQLPDLALQRCDLRLVIAHLRLEIVLFRQSTSAVLVEPGQDQGVTD